MTWRSRCYRSHPAASASQAIFAADRWILRTADMLAAWVEDSVEPIWQTSIPDDFSLGPRDVVCVTTGGDPLIVVTCAHADGDGCTLIAVDARSGAGRWQRRLALKPSSGGLQAHADRLYVHGYDEAGQRYVWLRLQASDGATRFERTSAELRSAAITADALWLAGWDSIDVLGHDGDSLFKTPMKMPTVAAYGEDVYTHAVAETGEAVVSWWRGNPVDRRAQLLLADLPVHRIPDVMLSPSSVPGRVAVAPFVDGAGVWMVDLNAGRTAWRQLHDGETQVWRQRVAGTSVAVVVRSVQGDRMLAFDAATGEAQGEIGTQVTVVQNIYATADRLLVSGLAEFEIFDSD